MSTPNLRHRIRDEGEGPKSCQEPSLAFLGRPTGRNDDSRPRRAAIAECQSDSPNGWPRSTLCRLFSSSADESAALTRATQLRGPSICLSTTAGKGFDDDRRVDRCHRKWFGITQLGEQPNGAARHGLAQDSDERLVVSVVIGNGQAHVGAVQRVVDKPAFGLAWRSAHTRRLSGPSREKHSQVPKTAIAVPKFSAVGCRSSGNLTLGTSTLSYREHQKWTFC